MTPEERSILHTIGNNFVYNTWHTAITTLFYGLYLVIFVISTMSFLSRRTKFLSSRILFFSNVVSFLVATVQWGDFVGDYVSQIHSSFLDGVDQPFDATRLTIIELQMFPAVVVSNWSSHLLPFIADIVVVWRSWVLFRDNKWLIAGPVVLLIAATAASITYLGLTSSLRGYIADDSGKNNSIESIYTAFLGLSLATNLAYTLLVFYKLWTHRCLVSRRGSHTPAERALLVLVESGALFCLFQVAMLGLVLVPKGISPSFNVVLGIVLCTYTLCCAIYPPVVVLLINYQKAPDVMTYDLPSHTDEEVGFTSGVEDVRTQTVEPE